MSAGTILVVDDSPETLGFLTEALERDGFTVLVALRGERALATVEQVHPDLVLMDATMPDMDGFETCRRLKRMAVASSIPVVFMTGLSATEHVLQGLEAGGVDYVTKPLVAQELIARIRVHLASARMVLSAHAAMDAAGQSLFAVDAQGRVRWATPMAQRLLATAAGFDGLSLPPPAMALLQDPGDAPPPDQVSLAVANGVSPAVASGVSVDLALVGRLRPGEYLLQAKSARETPDETLVRQRLPVTPREAEVLVWLTRGKSNRDIADILGLSPRTVNKHLEQVYAKLGVENRASAVVVTLRALRP